MTALSKIILLILVSISLSGCQNSPSFHAIPDEIDASTQMTIDLCKRAYGIFDVRNWTYQAEAVASFTENGGKTLISQKHSMQYIDDLLETEMQSSQTRLATEKIGSDDNLILSNCLWPQLPEEYSAARIKLYAIAISAFTPFMNRGMQFRSLQPESKGGTNSYIVQVKGNILSCCRSLEMRQKKGYYPDTARIWVDQKSGEITRIWLKFLIDDSNREYGYLSANVSNFARFQDNFARPTSIEFVPSDDNCSESGNTLMLVNIKRYNVDYLKPNEPKE